MKKTLPEILEENKRILRAEYQKGYIAGFREAENKGDMHQIEYCCPDCTNEIITILARCTKEVYLCPRCCKYFHVDEAIRSNYTWMYIEHNMEDEKHD